MFLTGMGSFGLDETLLTPFESVEGLGGIVDLFGEGGRLENALLVCVMGVLEGRSMGTVKFRKEPKGSPLRSWWEVPPMLVGTDGRENAGPSSSSSIEGKAWLKPVKS